MTLPVPLAVRLKTARADKYVTRELRDLSFRIVVPGGFASCSIDLDRPLELDPDEFELYGSMIVYDTRDASVEWEGRIEDPGRGADERGRIWNINSVGGMAHASDRRAPLVYIDQDLQDFVERARLSKHAGRTETMQDSNDTPALKFSFDRGTVLLQYEYVGLRYQRMIENGLKLGAVNYTWDGGVTDADFAVRAHVRTGLAGASTLIRANLLNAAGSGLSRKAVTTDWPNGANVLELTLWEIGAGGTGAGGVPDDVHYALFGTVSVQQLRRDASGNELTGIGNYPADTVTSAQVVADLLGRLLPKYDGANAAIAAGTYGIDQLMYENGITPAEVLGDIMDNFETDKFWAAWETGPTGLYRFEWTSWPTSVRYECDASDGFSAPGSAVDLYNKVHVRRTGPNGRTKTVTRNRAVQALTDAGLTREATIDLADEISSAANAVRAGDQFLAQHATAPNQGTLQIRRPILDILTGQMVQPWQLRPGNLIRVRDVRPRIDVLNPTDRDGVTIFRVYAVNYEASSNTASLELDSGVRSFRRASVQHRRVRAGRNTYEERESTRAKTIREKRESKLTAAERRAAQKRRNPSGHH